MSASRLSPRVRAALELFAWCTFIALLITLVFGAISGFRPVDRLAAGFVISLAISSCMGFLLGFVMGPAWPRLWALRAPLNWLTVISITLVLAGVALTIVVGVATALGFLSARYALDQFLQMYPTTAVISVIFGLWGTRNAALEARLVTASHDLQATRREEERARQIATEARLSSLESRVRPHFLFNTLNSISALVHDDPDRAESLLDHLSSLLRSSLDSSNQPTIPMGDELRLVQDYLEIERARFGDRLRCAVRVPDGLLNALVPPFSLQPLVENAVKHALASTPEGISIDVTGHIEDGALLLSVANDGPAFDVTVRHPGHGLHTLESRLRALYGHRATLEIERAGRQTRVMLKLPVEPG